jgi:hypothetical protein
MEEIDNEILKALIQDTQSMITTLKAKGTTEFKETSETGMLRVSIISLIGELQFYKVLPENLHVARGTVVRHLQHSKGEMNGRILDATGNGSAPAM